jgi:N-acetyl-D-muramate 6-phosphate phosphatase
MIRAVLFDLDGTLLDTAPDMIRAVNRLRALHGLDAVPSASVRPFVSKGGRAMIRAAFADWNEIDREPLLQPFLDLYREQIVIDTRLFEGFEETLRALEARGLALAIVTNKPAWLTEAVLTETGLAQRFAAVICGDTLPEKKPHPAPVLEACRLLDVEAKRAVMVGDDQRDIDSARAAGAYSIAVRFGYAGDDENLDDWRADAVIDAPYGLIDWLDAHTHDVIAP